MAVRVRIGLLSVLVAPAILASGCAKVRTPGGTGDAAAGPDGTAGQSDADAVADAGAPRDLSVSDFVPGDAPLVIGVDAACATESAMAEALPLDLYIMMDSSGSMLDQTSSGASKWDAVKEALSGFLRDPRSKGLGVGLQYFPLFQPGVPPQCDMDAQCGAFGPCLRLNTCRGPITTTQIIVCGTAANCPPGDQCVPLGMCPTEGDALCAPVGGSCQGGGTCSVAGGLCLARDRCEAASYAAPAVPIATLPAAANALVASLDAQQPGGATPTGPALAGALQAARGQAVSNPDHKVAVLLFTDGLPSECTPLAVTDIAALADASFRATPPVPTFVIGVFGDSEAASVTPNLNLLAASGGTGTAFVVDTTQDVTRALQGALNRIRTAALSCEFRIPSTSGAPIDFKKVNMTFTSGDGVTTVVGHVTAKDACDQTRGGWYYDLDPSTGAAPSLIVACDATCSALRSDPEGKIDIVLGCATMGVE
jgi:hypothetical protein